MNTPLNTTMDLMCYFSTLEKPMSRQEFDHFWDSCSIPEKHEFMCADLGEFNSTFKKAVLKSRIKNPVVLTDRPLSDFQYEKKRASKLLEQ